MIGSGKQGGGETCNLAPGDDIISSPIRLIWHHRDRGGKRQSFLRILIMVFYCSNFTRNCIKFSLSDNHFPKSSPSPPPPPPPTCRTAPTDEEEEVDPPPPIFPPHFCSKSNSSPSYSEIIWATPASSWSPESLEENKIKSLMSPTKKYNDFNFEFCPASYNVPDFAHELLRVALCECLLALSDHLAGAPALTEGAELPIV